MLAWYAVFLRQGRDSSTGLGRRLELCRGDTTTFAVRTTHFKEVGKVVLKQYR